MGTGNESKGKWGQQVRQVTFMNTFTNKWEEIWLKRELGFPTKWFYEYLSTLHGQMIQHIASSWKLSNCVFKYESGSHHDWQRQKSHLQMLQGKKNKQKKTHHSIVCSFTVVVCSLTGKCFYVKCKVWNISAQPRIDTSPEIVLSKLRKKG